MQQPGGLRTLQPDNYIAPGQDLAEHGEQPTPIARLFANIIAGAAVGSFENKTQPYPLLLTPGGSDTLLPDNNRASGKVEPERGSPVSGVDRVIANIMAGVVVESLGEKKKEAAPLLLTAGTIPSNPLDNYKSDIEFRAGVIMGKTSYEEIQVPVKNIFGKIKEGKFKTEKRETTLNIEQRRDMFVAQLPKIEATEQSKGAVFPTFVERLLVQANVSLDEQGNRIDWFTDSGELTEEGQLNIMTALEAFFQEAVDISDSSYADVLAELSQTLTKYKAAVTDSPPSEGLSREVAGTILEADLAVKLMLGNHRSNPAMNFEGVADLSFRQRQSVKDVPAPDFDALAETAKNFAKYQSQIILPTEASKTKRVYLGPEDKTGMTVYELYRQTHMFDTDGLNKHIEQGIAKTNYSKGTKLTHGEYMEAVSQHLKYIYDQEQSAIKAGELDPKDASLIMSDLGIGSDQRAGYLDDSKVTNKGLTKEQVDAINKSMSLVRLTVIVLGLITVGGAVAGSKDDDSGGHTYGLAHSDWDHYREATSGFGHMPDEADHGVVESLTHVADHFTQKASSPTEERFKSLRDGDGEVHRAASDVRPLLHRESPNSHDFKVGGALADALAIAQSDDNVPFIDSEVDGFEASNTGGDGNDGNDGNEAITGEELGSQNEAVMDDDDMSNGDEGTQTEGIDGGSEVSEDDDDHVALPGVKLTQEQIDRLAETNGTIFELEHGETISHALAAKGVSQEEMYGQDGRSGIINDLQTKSFSTFTHEGKTYVTLVVQDNPTDEAKFVHIVTPGQEVTRDGARVIFVEVDANALRAQQPGEVITKLQEVLHSGSVTEENLQDAINSIAENINFNETLQELLDAKAPVELSAKTTITQDAPVIVESYDDVDSLLGTPLFKGNPPDSVNQAYTWGVRLIPASSVNSNNVDEAITITPVRPFLIPDGTIRWQLDTMMFDNESASPLIVSRISLDDIPIPNSGQHVQFLQEIIDNAPPPVEGKDYIFLNSIREGSVVRSAAESHDLSFFDDEDFDPTSTLVGTTADGDWASFAKSVGLPDNVHPQFRNGVWKTFIIREDGGVDLVYFRAYTTDPRGVMHPANSTADGNLPPGTNIAIVNTNEYITTQNATDVIFNTPVHVMDDYDNGSTEDEDAPEMPDGVSTDVAEPNPPATDYTIVTMPVNPTPEELEQAYTNSEQLLIENGFVVTSNVTTQKDSAGNTVETTHYTVEVNYDETTKKIVTGQIHGAPHFFTIEEPLLPKTIDELRTMVEQKARTGVFDVEIVDGVVPSTIPIPTPEVIDGENNPTGSGVEAPAGSTATPPPLTEPSTSEIAGEAGDNTTLLDVYKENEAMASQIKENGVVLTTPEQGGLVIRVAVDQNNNIVSGNELPDDTRILDFEITEAERPIDVEGLIAIAESKIEELEEASLPEVNPPVEPAEQLASPSASSSATSVMPTATATATATAAAAMTGQAVEPPQPSATPPIAPSPSTTPTISATGFPIATATLIKPTENTPTPASSASATVGAEPSLTPTIASTKAPSPSTTPTISATGFPTATATLIKPTENTPTPASSATSTVGAEPSLTPTIASTKSPTPTPLVPSGDVIDDSAIPLGVDAEFIVSDHLNGVFERTYGPTVYKGSNWIITQNSFAIIDNKNDDGYTLVQFIKGSDDYDAKYSNMMVVVENFTDRESMQANTIILEEDSPIPSSLPEDLIAFFKGNIEGKTNLPTPIPSPSPIPSASPSTTPTSTPTSTLEETDASASPLPDLLPPQEEVAPTHEATSTVPVTILSNENALVFQQSNIWANINPLQGNDLQELLDKGLIRETDSFADGIDGGQYEKIFNQITDARHPGIALVPLNTDEIAGQSGNPEVTKADELRIVVAVIQEQDGTYHRVTQEDIDSGKVTEGIKVVELIGPDVEFDEDGTPLYDLAGIDVAVEAHFREEADQQDENRIKNAILVISGLTFLGGAGYLASRSKIVRDYVNGQKTAKKPSVSIPRSPLPRPSLVTERPVSEAVKAEESRDYPIINVVRTRVEGLPTEVRGNTEYRNITEINIAEKYLMISAPGLSPEQTLARVLVRDTLSLDFDNFQQYSLRYIASDGLTTKYANKSSHFGGRVYDHTSKDLEKLVISNHVSVLENPNLPSNYIQPADDYKKFDSMKNGMGAIVVRNIDGRSEIAFLGATNIDHGGRTSNPSSFVLTMRENRAQELLRALQFRELDVREVFREYIKILVTDENGNSMIPLNGEVPNAEPKTTNPFLFLDALFVIDERDKDNPTTFEIKMKDSEGELGGIQNIIDRLDSELTQEELNAIKVQVEKGEVSFKQIAQAYKEMIIGEDGQVAITDLAKVKRIEQFANNVRNVGLIETTFDTDSDIEITVMPTISITSTEHSEASLKHPKSNQDAVWTFRDDVTGTEWRAVLDGVSSDTNTSAQRAVEVLGQLAVDQDFNINAKTTEEVVNEVDKRLRQMTDIEGKATTISLARFRNNELEVANVGDSMVAVFDFSQKTPQVKIVTRGHTRARHVEPKDTGEAMDLAFADGSDSDLIRLFHGSSAKGMIRNMYSRSITHALNTGSTSIDSCKKELKAGQIGMIYTDGLTGNLSLTEVAMLLSAGLTAEDLVVLAKTKSMLDENSEETDRCRMKQDDITAIVFKVEEADVEFTEGFPGHAEITSTKKIITHTNSKPLPSPKPLEEYAKLEEVQVVLQDTSEGMTQEEELAHKLVKSTQGLFLHYYQQYYLVYDRDERKTTKYAIKERKKQGGRELSSLSQTTFKSRSQDIISGVVGHAQLPEQYIHKQEPSPDSIKHGRGCMVIDFENEDVVIKYAGGNNYDHAGRGNSTYFSLHMVPDDAEKLVAAITTGDIDVRELLRNYVEILVKDNDGISMVPLNGKLTDEQAENFNPMSNPFTTLDQLFIIDQRVLDDVKTFEIEMHDGEAKVETEETTEELKLFESIEGTTQTKVSALLGSPFTFTSRYLQHTVGDDMDVSPLQDYFNRIYYSPAGKYEVEVVKDGGYIVVNKVGLERDQARMLVNTGYLIREAGEPDVCRYVHTRYGQYRDEIEAINLSPTMEDVRRMLWRDSRFDRNYELPQNLSDLVTKKLQETKIGSIEESLNEIATYITSEMTEGRLKVELVDVSTEYGGLVVFLPRFVEVATTVGDGMANEMVAQAQEEVTVDEYGINPVLTEEEQSIVREAIVGMGEAYYMDLQDIKVLAKKENGKFNIMPGNRRGYERSWRFNHNEVGYGVHHVSTFERDVFQSPDTPTEFKVIINEGINSFNETKYYKPGELRVFTTQYEVNGVTTYSLNLSGNHVTNGADRSRGGGSCEIDFVFTEKEARDRFFQELLASNDPKRLLAGLINNTFLENDEPSKILNVDNKPQGQSGFEHPIIRTSKIIFYDPESKRGKIIEKTDEGWRVEYESEARMEDATGAEETEEPLTLRIPDSEINELGLKRSSLFALRYGYRLPAEDREKLNAYLLEHGGEEHLTDDFEWVSSWAQKKEGEFFSFDFFNIPDTLEVDIGGNTIELNREEIKELAKAGLLNDSKSSNSWNLSEYYIPEENISNYTDVNKFLEKINSNLVLSLLTIYNLPEELENELGSSASIIEFRSVIYRALNSGNYELQAVPVVLTTDKIKSYELKIVKIDSEQLKPSTDTDPSLDGLSRAESAKPHDLLGRDETDAGEENPVRINEYFTQRDDAFRILTGGSVTLNDPQLITKLAELQISDYLSDNTRRLIERITPDNIRSEDFRVRVSSYGISGSELVIYEKPPVKLQVGEIELDGIQVEALIGSNYLYKQKDGDKYRFEEGRRGAMESIINEINKEPNISNISKLLWTVHILNPDAEIPQTIRDIIYRAIDDGQGQKGLFGMEQIAESIAQEIRSGKVKLELQDLSEQYGGLEVVMARFVEGQTTEMETAVATMSGGQEEPTAFERLAAKIDTLGPDESLPYGWMEDGQYVRAGDLLLVELGNLNVEEIEEDDLAKIVGILNKISEKDLESIGFVTFGDKLLMSLSSTENLKPNVSEKIDKAIRLKNIVLKAKKFGLLVDDEYLWNSGTDLINYELSMNFLDRMLAIESDIVERMPQSTRDMITKAKAGFSQKFIEAFFDVQNLFGHPKKLGYANTQEDLEALYGQRPGLIDSIINEINSSDLDTLIQELEAIVNLTNGEDYRWIIDQLNLVKEVMKDEKEYKIVEMKRSGMSSEIYFVDAQSGKYVVKVFAKGIKLGKSTKSIDEAELDAYQIPGIEKHTLKFDRSIIPGNDSCIILRRAQILNPNDVPEEGLVHLKSLDTVLRKSGKEKVIQVINSIAEFYILANNNGVSPGFDYKSSSYGFQEEVDGLRFVTYDLGSFNSEGTLVDDYCEMLRGNYQLLEYYSKYLLGNVLDEYELLYLFGDDIAAVDLNFNSERVGNLESKLNTLQSTNPDAFKYFIRIYKTASKKASTRRKGNLLDMPSFTDGLEKFESLEEMLQEAQNLLKVNEVKTESLHEGTIDDSAKVEFTVNSSISELFESKADVRNILLGGSISITDPEVVKKLIVYNQAGFILNRVGLTLEAIRDLAEGTVKIGILEDNGVLFLEVSESVTEGAKVEDVTLNPQSVEELVVAGYLNKDRDTQAYVFNEFRVGNLESTIEKVNKNPTSEDIRALLWSMHGVDANATLPDSIRDILENGNDEIGYDSIINRIKNVSKDIANEIASGKVRLELVNESHNYGGLNVYKAKFVEIKQDHENPPHPVDDGYERLVSDARRTVSSEVQDSPEKYLPRQVGKLSISREELIALNLSPRSQIRLLLGEKVSDERESERLMRLVATKVDKDIEYVSYLVHEGSDDATSLALFGPAKYQLAYPSTDSAQPVILEGILQEILFNKGMLGVQSTLQDDGTTTSAIALQPVAEVADALLSIINPPRGAGFAHFKAVDLDSEDDTDTVVREFRHIGDIQKRAFALRSELPDEIVEEIARRAEENQGIVTKRTMYDVIDSKIQSGEYIVEKRKSYLPPDGLDLYEFVLVKNPDYKAADAMVSDKLVVDASSTAALEQIASIGDGDVFEVTHLGATDQTAVVASSPKRRSRMPAPAKVDKLDKLAQAPEGLDEVLATVEITEPILEMVKQIKDLLETDENTTANMLRLYETALKKLLVDNKWEEITDNRYYFTEIIKDISRAKAGLSISDMQNVNKLLNRLKMVIFRNINLGGMSYKEFTLKLLKKLKEKPESISIEEDDDDEEEYEF